MFRALSFAVVLLCAGCAEEPDPIFDSALPSQMQVAQVEPQPNCREYTGTVTIAGKPQQAFGTACRQPDGTWRITEDTPGSAPQVYTLPPQAIHAAPYPYPYYWADPWAYGPPFFAGGSIFFADGFHHFHRFHHFHSFHHDGFHGPGFHGGFHGGGHR
jgi:surface antigen